MKKVATVPTLTVPLIEGRLREPEDQLDLGVADQGFCVRHAIPQGEHPVEVDDRLGHAQIRGATAGLARGQERAGQVVGGGPVVREPAQQRQPRLRVRIDS